MSDERQDAAEPAEGTPNRRRLLMLGALSASAVVTIRPAMAQTAASVLNCEIPVPEPSRQGNFIAPDGSLVPWNAVDKDGKPLGFPPPGRALTGEEVRSGLASGRLSGFDADRSQAYLNYVRNLQSGMSGFTCYASLQMPRA